MNNILIKREFHIQLTNHILF